jgi:F-type H+-transporting ATPase subunit a
MTYLISSPLEQFETVPLISLHLPIIGDLVLSLTNLGLYTIITLVLIIGLYVVANNQHRLVPNRWSLMLESMYATVAGIVRAQIGPAYEMYTPLVFSFFMFVLVANLNGNVPYAYTITTSAVTAIGLSLLVFFAVTILAAQRHGLHAFSFFVPSGTPLALVPILVLIELISYLARAVSLGVRLFSNIVAGHTLLKILSTFLGKLFTAGIITAVITLIPFTVFVALMLLEIAVSFVQAYVFTVLTSSYLKDAIELH